jgi:hypothetical protein
MKATFLTLFAAAILALALPAVAEMYRWVDENGRVHYSDQPPPATRQQQQDMKTKIRSKPGSATANANPSYVEKEADFRKRQVEKAEKEAADQKAQQQAADKQQNCHRARQHLATMQAGGRVARSTPEGEREFLDDAQIAQEIQEAQKSVAEWCN